MERGDEKLFKNENVFWVSLACTITLKARRPREKERERTRSRGIPASLYR